MRADPDIPQSRPEEAPLRCLGIDLGGTKIAAGVVDAAGSLSGFVTIPTPARRGPDAVVDAMVALAHRSLSEAGVGLDAVAAVGVGAPGPVDAVQGLVVAPPNLPGWSEVPLAARLAARLERPVVLDNDANAAGLGEARFGAGQGAVPLLYLTVSTGIGGAIVLADGLLRGAAGAAGEVGHMVVVPGGPRCGCGGRGCLEAVASGTAIAREATRALSAGQDAPRLRARCGDDPGRVTAAAVAAAAAEGDALCRRILDEALTYLGLGVASLVNVLNPARVVVGGGLTGMGPRLLESIRSGIAAHANPVAAGTVTIRPAALGPAVGVLGAAALAFEEGAASAEGLGGPPRKLAPAGQAD